ncbi:type VI secretion system contractile sheath small subunit [Colwellia sp. 20A7]|jgi:type VI secretion system protein ImpB|uniref:type VI secretion system contractile sheath small subunit n=1 Tax=Colwellia sp. 20A7 TaxID=2689569 RepID=UPI00135C0BE8|nr:type VI secretion system contractile sheath small subunit [Colwellia sp. 20A7]
MSIHDKLKRVRKPRVHITYDVETEGAVVKKELPFVIGITGDFSGHNTKDLKPLKDRRFVQIDRDNFDDVLNRMNPQLEIAVDNTLTDDDTQLKVALDFKSLNDFEPASIVNQVEPLKKMMETRNKLRDLMTKVDRSEDLENILEDVLSNTASLDKLAKELDIQGAK